MTKLVAASLLGLTLAATTHCGEAFPAPAPAKDDGSLGANIQRTMTLLATSTPEHRNKVKILFYGQSITQQDWWKPVADDLRKRFPHADLTVENLAIGGFASQMLCRTAEHDLYPFYPDLLIFHVYGANQQYEEIIAATRKRTTAEILMQKDHACFWPPEKADMNKDKGQWWDGMMNNQFLPQIAKKHGCQLADIRTGWLDYLKANKLEPKALLRDSVHLNEQGCFLMAELVKQQLVHKPQLPNDSWKDMVRTLDVGKDVAWKDGKLVLEFDGNRVDVLAAKSAGQPAARVLIDGKKPSEFPDAYTITRPGPTQLGYWPGVIRVGWEKPLLVEDWELRITETNDEGSQFKFEVKGSKTGPDGNGSAAEKFVSNSGRVVIDPKDWHFKRAFDHGKKKLTAGFVVKWQVKPLFVDSYTPPQVDDPSREHATTLAQNIPNAKHTLELVAEGNTPPAIRAIRVYRPPEK